MSKEYQHYVNSQTNLHIDKSTTSNYNGINFSFNYSSSSPLNEANGAPTQNESQHGQRSYCDVENSLHRGQRVLLTDSAPSDHHKCSMHHDPGRRNSHCGGSGLTRINDVAMPSDNFARIVVQKNLSNERKRKQTTEQVIEKKKIRQRKNQKIRTNVFNFSLSIYNDLSNFRRQFWS